MSPNPAQSRARVEVYLDRLLPWMSFNERLEALQKLTNGNARYFCLKSLEEEDFETLGAKFGLSYKGVAALYYSRFEIQKNHILLKEVTRDEFECLLSVPRPKQTIHDSYARPLLLKYAIIDGGWIYDSPGIGEHYFVEGDQIV